MFLERCISVEMDLSVFNLSQDGHFWVCTRMFGGGGVGGGGEGQKCPIPKICHTDPTIMKQGAVKIYLKKIQKIYESRVTSLEFC